MSKYITKRGGSMDFSYKKTTTMRPASKLKIISTSTIQTTFFFFIDNTHCGIIFPSTDFRKLWSNRNRRCRESVRYLEISRRGSSLYSRWSGKTSRRIPRSWGTSAYLKATVFIFWIIVPTHKYYYNVLRLKFSIVLGCIVYWKRIRAQACRNYSSIVWYCERFETFVIQSERFFLSDVLLR